ncbi:MAG TPA: YsnF/AvaK domain-containing protein [Ktedonobacteraceae bacterium]
MTTTNQSFVTGIFADEQHAQQAMASLQEAGFSNKQIQYSPHKSGASILDSLTGMGFGQEDATYYDNEFRQGHTIVTVNDDERQQEAATILQRNGASLASQRGQLDGEAASAPTAQGISAAEGEQRMKLREERLQASKEQVQVGEVELRKEVVTEQQSIDVPVTHEEVYIERRPGSGQVSNLPIGKDGETISVPLRAEQVNVTKQAVETGEVTLGRRQVQETQRVSDTVRHDEARLEREGDVTIEGDDTGAQR